MYTEERNKPRMRFLTRFFRRFLTSCSLTILISSAFFPRITDVSAQAIMVTWNRGEEVDLVGYKVYYGKASRIYPYFAVLGNVTEYAIPALPDSGTFFFAVTAYDSAGNESHYSQEASLHVGESSDRFFFLFANYPNPFNPETQIPYFLPDRLFISLVVYDLMGRQVRIIEEGNKEAGWYTAKWDGCDESGVRVANGIYFCRMRVGSYCQTRKLILTR